MESYVYPIIPIAACGTITNILSLSFFVRKSKKCLGDRLFVVLNSFDLLVCISCVLKLVFRSKYFEDLEKYSTWYFLFYGTTCLYQVAMGATGFTTCVLSIVRSISLWDPFYRAKGKAIAISIGIFVLVVAARVVIMEFSGLLSAKKGWIVRACFISLMILVVTISTVATIVKLMKVKTELGEDHASPEAKRATITVIIVSLLFCVLNLQLAAGLWVIGTVGNQTAGRIAIWYAVPLNSALNPVVYLFRIKQMREYLRECWRRLMGRLRRNGVQAGRQAVPSTCSVPQGVLAETDGEAGEKGVQPEAGGVQDTAQSEIGGSRTKGVNEEGV